MTLPSLLAPPILFALLAAPGLPQEPEAEPARGTVAHTGARIHADPGAAGWSRPAFHYDPVVATGRKLSRVVVVIYDPVLESEGGKTLREFVGGNDPLEFSRILVDVVREASWGYLNYEIVDVVTIDGYPTKVDGFRYTDESFLAARAEQKWQPATSSYRGILEESGVLGRIAEEDLREVWLWGASGMHFDEFAGYVPERDERFGPTDNPWLYRPYDIPEEVGRTFWVMGFNHEVGADNMIHSYTHRVESMAALGLADGIWDPATRRDPWNVFSFLQLDHPDSPSMVGNCHVPPNGERGYDYGNPRRVASWAYNWHRYPDLRGPAVEIGQDAWGRNQFGYQKWILERVPKGPGATEHGYANWWVYIGNTDGDLPEWKGPAPEGPDGLGKLRLPASFPASRRSDR